MLQHVWMRWIVRATVLILLAVVPSLAHAQRGKLTGVVTDAATGAPIDGVQIVIEGTGLGSLTQENGRFFILNVPVGTYAVTARRIGYQSAQRTNVLFAIDVTTTTNFALNFAAAQQLGEISVTAARTPLIVPGMTGSSVPMSGEFMRSLPVVSIEGALRLQQGFLQVPDNSDIVSYGESRRNVTNPIRIRGGRGGETMTLIDGIPVNNPIYGGPAISMTPEGVEQLDFLKGGFEPQYGNALSGIINIATRNGGETLAGSLRYQSSAAGDLLGNTPDGLLRYSLVDGFVSGPLPFTDRKLRFMVAVRQERSRDAVLEFDQDVFDPSSRTDAQGYPFLGPNFMDLFPGWRGFGFNTRRDVFTKLTWVVSPRTNIGFSMVDYQQQRQPFDFTWLLTYDDPLSSPVINSAADSVAIIGNRTGSRIAPLDFHRTVQGSIDASRRLYVGRLDHNFGRTTLGASIGRFELSRKTCNVWQGVCLGANFGDPNFSEDQFISPLAGTCDIHPTCGSDYVFGGETMKSSVLRADVASQVSDHHNLQFGVFYERHDVRLDEVDNIGVNNVISYPIRYHATPWDGALYLQDRIEFDFLIVKLGARFDFGAAGGRGWANPLDPTNGTTADNVCSDPSSWQNVSLREYDPAGDSTYTSSLSALAAWSTLGLNCGGVDSVLALAGRIASSDDFRVSKRRQAFSPRIGLSFPLSSSSSLFFNFGRYTQNPLLNNLFLNTGIGTNAEGTVFGPTLRTPGGGVPPFIGNPSLLTEATTSYEVGFTSEIGSLYGLSFTLFSKDQVGLTGLRTGGTINGVQVFDPAATYGSSNTPSYRILVNQDFQTVRGLDVQLRRRVTHYVGFDINFSLSEARSNAADPERETERQINEGDPRLNSEVRSEIDQPFSLNTALLFQVGDEAPSMPLGSLLRNLSASLVFRAQSGVPYTPTLDFIGQGLSQLTRNSGRAPSTFQLDLQLSKQWLVSGLRYGFTLQVLNLTDRKNCIQVFTTTGTCEVGAVDTSRNREGNTIAADAVTTTYLNRPQYYGSRRSVQAGIRVSF